jgi:hypothetical protein
MYRNYAWLPAAVFMAFLAVACSDTVTTPNPLATDAPLAMEASSVETIVWTGHGSDNLPCDGGYHWILAGHHGGTAVPVFFSEIGGVPQTGADMYRPSNNNDPTTNAAWHYDSGLIDLEEGVTPYVFYEGADLSQAVLTISNCLDNGLELEGEIVVEKTVNTSYDLEHGWDIDKNVETENGHELEDGTPKIWLYTDGSGDETATWTVDVTYLGSEATDIQVWGDITVTVPLTSDFSALIDGVSDELLGEDVPVVCDFEPFAPATDFPIVMDPGDVLECSYTATLEELPEEDGSNVATATGQFLDPADTPISEEDQVDVIFGDPDNELYACVEIVDTNAGFALEYDTGEGVELCAEDLEVDEVTTFEYEQDFAWGDYGQEGCGSDRIENTATIVETEQSADAELAVNIQCYEFNSAWALGEGGDVEPYAFCDNGFANWGWSNRIERDYEGAWPLYAGAAQCDPDKGMLVGYFHVSHTAGGFVKSFVPLPGLDVLFEGEAVYADAAMFPKTPRGANTVAPGQYYIAEPLVDAIYVIAHVNAGIPDPDFGPEN